MSGPIPRKFSHAAADQSSRQASILSVRSKAISFSRRRGLRTQSFLQLVQHSSPSMSPTQIQRSETWKEQKEKFLKQPFLRKKSKSEKRRPRRKSRRGRRAPPTIVVEDWSSMTAGLRLSGVFDQDVVSSCMAVQNATRRCSVLVSSSSLSLLESPWETNSTSNVEKSESPVCVVEDSLPSDPIVSLSAPPSMPVSVDTAMRSTTEDTTSHENFPINNPVAILSAEAKIHGEVKPGEIYEAETGNNNGVGSPATLGHSPASSSGTLEERSRPLDSEHLERKRVTSEEEKIIKTGSNVPALTSCVKTPPQAFSSTNLAPSPEYGLGDSLSLPTAVTLFSPRLLLAPLISHTIKKSRWTRKFQLMWPGTIASLSSAVTAGFAVDSGVRMDHTVNSDATSNQINDTMRQDPTEMAVEEVFSPTTVSSTVSVLNALPLDVIEAIEGNDGNDTLTPRPVSLSTHASPNITHCEDFDKEELQVLNDESSENLIPYPDVFDLDVYLEKRWSSIGPPTSAGQSDMPIVVNVPPPEEKTVAIAPDSA